MSQNNKIILIIIAMVLSALAITFYKEYTIGTDNKPGVEGSGIFGFIVFFLLVSFSRFIWRYKSNDGKKDHS